MKQTATFGNYEYSQQNYEEINGNIYKYAHLLNLHHSYLIHIGHKIMSYNLLFLLRQVITALFRSNLTSIDQQTLNTQILSSSKYTIIVNLLLTIIINYTKPQKYNRDIIKCSFTIIQNLTQRMDDTELQIFKATMLMNNTSDKIQRVINLLYGAPKQLLDIFEYEDIINMLIDGSAIEVEEFKNIYYLFIKRYLVVSQYISFETVQSLSNFVIRHIQYHQNQFFSSNSKNHQDENQQITKISILISIYIKMGLIESLEHNEEYFNYFKKKVFYYLIHSFLGMPQIAHQNIFQGIVQFINKGRTLQNYEIASNLINIYIQIFHSNVKSSSILKSDIKKNKLQEQMIYLIRISLNICLLKENELRIKLKHILMNPPIKLLIQSQILALYLKVYQLENHRLQNNHPLKYQHNQQQLQIQKQFIYTVIKQTISSKHLQQLFYLLEVAAQNAFIIKFQSYIQNIQNSVKLLLQLSLHVKYHLLINHIIIEFIHNHQNNLSSLAQLRLTCFKSNMKCQEQVANQILKYELYLPCILEVLSLNPEWNSNDHFGRRQIAQSLYFKQCLNNLNQLQMYNLSMKIQNISLSSEQDSQTSWSFRYLFLVKTSAISAITNKRFSLRLNEDCNQMRGVKM